MFLCVELCRSEQDLVIVALELLDGEQVPSLGFTRLNESFGGQADANLGACTAPPRSAHARQGMGGARPVHLSWCSTRRSAMTSLPARDSCWLDGTYACSSWPALDGLSLRAVGPVMSGVPAPPGGDEALTRHGRPAEWIEFAASATEDPWGDNAAQSTPGVTLRGLYLPAENFGFCVLADSAQTLHLVRARRAPPPAPLRALAADLLHRQACTLAFSEGRRSVAVDWARGPAKGKLGLFRDDYQVLAMAHEPAEYWQRGERVYTDRSAGFDVQALVDHHFSSQTLERVRFHGRISAVSADAAADARTSASCATVRRARASGRCTCRRPAW
jgi:hypothetical protein